MKEKRYKWITYAFWVGLFFLVLANYIVLINKPAIATDVAQLPENEIALVFGGGMIDHELMSGFQQERVDAAIQLYMAGKVQRLIMTGDDGAMKGNAVEAMKAYAMKHGVPEADIALDPHGYNTYTSCLRGHTEYDLENITAVSQTFHLSRIIYFCERQGIETIGYAADDSRPGWHARFWTSGGRVILARLKAVWQAEITKPGPLMFE